MKDKPNSPSPPKSSTRPYVPQPRATDAAPPWPEWNRLVSYDVTVEVHAQLFVKVYYVRSGQTSYPMLYGSDKTDQKRGIKRAKEILDALRGA